MDTEKVSDWNTRRMESRIHELESRVHELDEENVNLLLLSDDLKNTVEAIRMELASVRHEVRCLRSEVDGADAAAPDSAKDSINPDMGEIIQALIRRRKEPTP